MPDSMTEVTRRLKRAGFNVDRRDVPRIVRAVEQTENSFNRRVTSPRNRRGREKMAQWRDVTDSSLYDAGKGVEIVIDDLEATPERAVIVAALDVDGTAYSAGDAYAIFNFEYDENEEGDWLPLVGGTVESDTQDSRPLTDEELDSLRGLEEHIDDEVCEALYSIAGQPDSDWYEEIRAEYGMD